MKAFRSNYSSILLSLSMAAPWLGSLQAQMVPVIPTTYALTAAAADPTKPGFVWNVSQVTNPEANQLAWAELQLAGFEGPNLADPNAVGIAVGPASPPSPNTAPISFVITNVINLNITAGGTSGNFTPDDQMPGLPGTASGTDNSAGEALTYLLLPAGTITMGVNSDDGFRVTLGGANPEDKFAVDVGQWDGSRGANDSIFQFTVTQPGLFAARLLWFNGGGSAAVEWFTILDGLTGTNKVLINDVANGGIPAYQAASVAHAYVSKLDPVSGATDVAANEGLHLAIVDGSVPVAQNSIGLILDNTVVSPALTKTGNVTSVDFTPSAPWLSQSQHTASIIFSDGALKVTNSWSFTVQNYLALDPAWRVAAVDTTKPGFSWNIFANSDAANVGNGNERAERDLSLQALDANGTSLVNLADPAAVGAAAGPGVASSAANGPIHFEIATTINLDIATPNMPGAPSTDATTDGQAAEVVTYLSLPAGVVGMQVDSDDGWRLYSGSQPADLFGRTIVAEHNGRTGPVKFSILVPQAGIYPFRMIWENGTGGSHLIWSSVDNTGKATLINDLAKGGIPAYRALPAGTTVHPYIVGATPVAAIHQFKLANTNLTVVIADGTTAIDDTSITLTVDGKTITPVTQRSGGFISISDGGTAFTGLQLPQDVHSASLTFKDSTGAYTRSQQWSFNNIQILVLPANPVVQENFDSYSEATSSANTVPPGWTAWNFTQENTPGWDLTAKDSDSYKDWIIISTDTVTGIEGGSLGNDPTQTINGQPVANFASGNILWATSDGRSGPQVQFCMSKPFDLSSITNPVMIFSSLMRMSAEANVQADGIEYSVDGGTTWNPGIIYVTVAHSRPDYQILTPSGDLDVVRCLNLPVVQSQHSFGTWTDPGPGPFKGQTRGDSYAAGLEETVTQDLAPLLAIRDDDTGTSTKVDGFRLPKASKKSSVILRFYQLGNCSWWWGVDNLAFYDIAPPVQTVQTASHIDSISVAGGTVTIHWSGGGTLQSSPSLTNPTWTSTANSSGTYSAAAPSTGNLFFRVKN